MTDNVTTLAPYDDPEFEKLPAEVKRVGLTANQWNNLKNNLFPGAGSQSILNVVAYCRARGLDPMKKPCHIVPIRVKDEGGNWGYRDVVMPGIYELRTTAMRTGQYVGMEPPVFGEEIDFMGLRVPEWVQINVRRKVGNEIGVWGVPVYFEEAVATTFDKDTRKQVPNATWKKRPKGMLMKCAEAQSLRMAFPDELGGEMTADEMAGQSHGEESAPPIIIEGETQRERLKALLAKPDPDAEIEVTATIDETPEPLAVGQEEPENVE